MGKGRKHGVAFSIVLPLYYYYPTEREEKKSWKERGKAEPLEETVA